jgi:predicted phosphodiesterase
VKRLVLFPDSQFDSHDKKLHELFVEFLKDYRPDRLVHVGDFLDCKAPARWSAATSEEFAGTLQGEIDSAHAWLTAVRSVYDGPFSIKSGNHDQRIATYLRIKAPAFSSLRSLQIETLLGLEDLNVSWHHGAIDLAPGWICLHGHESSLSRIAGGTAMGLARKTGKSVVTGHTHRAGVINESVGYGGKLKVLTGMEIGHSMDLRKAAYLALGAANWQQALGILYIDGTRVTPSLIPVNNGRFTVEGKTYGG